MTEPSEAGRGASPLARFSRGAGVLLAFCALTVAMTWPWVLDLDKACSDQGDPYLIAWTLWNDFQKTFHDPLNLFHGGIFFPSKYTLAFSEHTYGIALLCFPLFLAGVAPLTVHGVAMLFGIAFSGFGAFRLARTVTGSTAAAWAAGIAFAFVPYRFHHLPHLYYLFSGWMPLTLEALVLFVRERSKKRALWLGAAFAMNALTCIHWMVLSLLPLVLCGVFLAFRNGMERDRDFLRRGALALAGAGVVLLPFLVPYVKVAKLYGFVRSVQDCVPFSAMPRHWLLADGRNHLWAGFGGPMEGELCLFPGLLLLLLPGVALLLARRPGGAAPELAAEGGRRNMLLGVLDALSLLAAVVFVLSSTPKPFTIALGGQVVFRASDTTRAFAALAILLPIRWAIAYPKAFGWARHPNLLASLRAPGRHEVVGLALFWIVPGFFGSLGVNAPFHRALYELVPLYRSIRVPARWAMVANVGLALLAGAAVWWLAERLRARGFRRAAAAVAPFACAALLLELRVAPLELYRGEPYPDDLTKHVATLRMKGALLELPMGGDDSNFLYMLRACDHGHPIVNGQSGFAPRPYLDVEEMLWKRPIPRELFDLLESLPVSYVTARFSRIRPDEKSAYQAWLRAGVETGRLRHIGRFGDRVRDDLYALVRIEPDAKPLGPRPAYLSSDAPPLLPIDVTTGRARSDDRLIGSVDDPPEGGVVEGTLVVRGWARSPDEDYQVKLLLDGDEERFPTEFQRVPRTDVQQVLPQMGDCSTAGYRAVFEFHPGDEGERRLWAIFIAKDGRTRLYPVRRFTWKPPR